MATIEAIYPAPHNGSPEFTATARLLRLAVECTDVAVAADAVGDAVAADYELSKLRGLLPELFCCRSLGDGYGAVIVALTTVLQEHKTRPLSTEQIRAIKALLKALRERPLMRIQTALDEIEKLERAGLNTTPKVVEALGQILGE